MTDGELGAPEELAAELERLRGGNPPPPIHPLQATPEGRELYGDPQRGGTLDQAWRVQVKLGGVATICLFVPERVAAPTAITTVETMAPDELVATLIGILAREGKDGGAPMCFVRGKFSHAINVLTTDGEWVTYQDPWPGQSLLARERGYFGVDVSEVAPRRWRISRADLEKILYAAFITPAVWARVIGQSYRVEWNALRASELFTFFQLREASATQNDGRTVHQVEQPRFRQNVGLAFTVDGDGTLFEAALRMDQAWLRANLPIVLDLAKSFVRATLPPADREPARPLLEMLFALQRGDVATAKRITDGDSPLKEFIDVLWGRFNSATCVYPYSTVTSAPATLDNGILGGWSAITVRSR